MKNLRLLFLFSLISIVSLAQKTGTCVVLLGTGTPNPDPERSGPSLAIIVNNHSYVVDCGPGVVRRAAAAAKKEIPSLKSEGLTRLFITHLHSDHVGGYSDFMLSHGSWVNAFGYRFETKDKVIVVSGDCTYSESVVANAMDCDILIHEVYSMEGLAKRDEHWKKYHSTFHTSTAQLAEIANKTKPKLLVLTHQLPFGMSKESLLKELQDRYKGAVQYGNDLDTF